MSTKADFDAFWLIAKDWRDGRDNYPRHAAVQFHRAVKLGAAAADIIHGARVYTSTDLHDDPQFQPSAAKWLSGGGWERYAGQEIHEYRELSAFERKAWQAAGYRGPDKARVGVPCWPPGHKATAR